MEGLIIVLALTAWVIFISIALPWISFKYFGESAVFGVLMVFCRRSKYTQWLVWNIWGNEGWFLDRLEKGMEEWRIQKCNENLKEMNRNTSKRF